MPEFGITRNTRVTIKEVNPYREWRGDDAHKESEYKNLVERYIAYGFDQVHEKNNEKMLKLVKENTIDEAKEHGVLRDVLQSTVGHIIDTLAPGVKEDPELDHLQEEQSA